MEEGEPMNRRHHPFSAAWIMAGALALSALVSAEAQAQTRAPAVDSQALRILRRSMDYLGGQRQFSVRAHTMREDLLESGNRVDFEVRVAVTIRRPNKLRSERQDARYHQSFYYDGTTLTMYNAQHRVYATAPLPGTIESMFQFADDSLGFDIPVTDLLWHDVFPLLTQGVTRAVVIGKEVIGGVSCDHLLFSRPDVDFQIWVADSGRPLPLKYVVTDTGTPALLSMVSLLSDWNFAPAVSDAWFTFVPPRGTAAIPFLRFDHGSGLSR
jgi:hypothetical protein